MKKIRNLIVAFMLIAVLISQPLMTCAAAEEGPDYLIKVNRAANCLTVYSQDAVGEFTVPVIAFACSTGKNNATRVGEFSTSNKYKWRLMKGGVYTQYATRFDNGRLIHSEPYYHRSKDSLEWQEYNKLGEQASAGCVRLACIDAKWIYDHCKSNTKVIVYDDADNPGPLGKPTSSILLTDHPNRGWDPTDPDPNNPWATVRPQLAVVANTPGNNILYLPAGSTSEMLRDSIVLFAADGTPYPPTTYILEVYGQYNLNTVGQYQIYLRGFDASGQRADLTVELSVTPGVVGVPAITAPELSEPKVLVTPDGLPMPTDTDVPPMQAGLETDE